MSIKIAFFELPRLDLHGLYLLEVLLVIQAITKDIAERA